MFDTIAAVNSNGDTDSTCRLTRRPLFVLSNDESCAGVTPSYHHHAVGVVFNASPSTADAGRAETQKSAAATAITPSHPAFIRAPFIRPPPPALQADAVPGVAARVHDA